MLQGKLTWCMHFSIVTWQPFMQSSHWTKHVADLPRPCDAQLPCERDCTCMQYSLHNSLFRWKTLWKVSVLQVNALVHAVQAHTPKRWSLVSDLVILAASYKEGDRRTFVELQVPSESSR